MEHCPTVKKWTNLSRNVLILKKNTLISMACVRASAYPTMMVKTIHALITTSTMFAEHANLSKSFSRRIKYHCMTHTSYTWVPVRSDRAISNKVLMAILWDMIFLKHVSNLSTNYRTNVGLPPLYQNPWTLMNAFQIHFNGSMIFKFILSQWL